MRGGRGDTKEKVKRRVEQRIMFLAKAP